MNIPPNDDAPARIVWDDRHVDFVADRLVERLHRLFVILEDDFAHRGLEMPPVAIYDVGASRWLLAAGVPLATLRQDPTRGNVGADYLILIGPTTAPVFSANPVILMATFVSCTRTLATA